MVMTRSAKMRSQKTGLPPGTLMHIGTERTEKVKITVFDYDETHFEEKEVYTVEECFPFKDRPTVTWINIDGIHQVEIVEKIGKYFDVHPLVLEDIVSTGQRPKVEDFGEYLYIVLKMLYYDGNDGEVKSEQVSVIVGSQFVISFQERQGDVFNPIRERIRAGKGYVRRMGADFLA
jgi:magnesium transporter